MTTALALEQISFTYAGATKPALHDISIAIPDGQICAVIGRAGAGKSTLCALCAGFIPHFFKGQLSGSAIVDGQDALARPVTELVRHVVLVGGNAFSQISGARQTVYEEVGFALENLGVPRAEIIERVDWALEAMQIAPLRDRSPYRLSGGQQQRMVIAAALALRPPVLVLDEPTAQLDPPSIAELAELLRHLSDTGTTIVVAEHRLEWVAELADRTIALDTGALIADGPTAQVLVDPLLRERGIGWPRPALYALRAQADGRWPVDAPLPTTLAGLRAGLVGRAAPKNRRTEEAEDNSTAANAGERSDLQHSTFDIQRSDTQYAIDAIISLDDVRYTYPGGVEAVRGVSLQIGAGERVALLGRNGAGKSTLVRHLNGLLHPSSGRALVAGNDTRNVSVAACARHVGIVFQDIRNQLFAATVREELRFGPRNLGYPAARIDELVAEALAALALEDAADSHPYDLPAPRRRLVAIAAIVAMDPMLLVLDEPTAGLDNAAIDLLEALVAERAARGRSVLVVTHDLDFCFEALDRIVLMQGGEVILDTPRDAIAAAERDLLAGSVGLPLLLQL
jgi:energy-coupling factor transport system ATP-binding protein